MPRVWRLAVRCDEALNIRRRCKRSHDRPCKRSDETGCKRSFDTGHTNYVDWRYQQGLLAIQYAFTTVPLLWRQIVEISCITARSSNWRSRSLFSGSSHPASMVKEHPSTSTVEQARDARPSEASHARPVSLLGANVDAGINYRSKV